jgi:hypothetical protein
VLSDLKQKPLTDDEIAALWPGSVTWAALFDFARRIEAAHGIGEDVQGMQAEVFDSGGVLRTQRAVGLQER